MKEQLTTQDYIYSTKLGCLMGFVIGWAIGIALILYLDSPAMTHWGGMPSIPFWFAVGWMLDGFIVGGTGLFAHVGVKPTVARAEVTHLEKHAA